jgi:4-amino-4-deoxy-L-arabinose transferase-like glycosyltransferase
MSWIKRKWTGKEAQEWTKEDVIAWILSPLAYLGLTAGIALTLLLKWPGYILLALAIVFTFLIFWIQRPKLEAASEEYEKRQKEYLKELEKIERWEER